MNDNTRRRNSIIIAPFVVALIIAILLMLTRCLPERPANTAQSAETAPSAPDSLPGVTVPGTAEPAEVLTAATLTAPQQVAAGAVFIVAWTGPNNRGDSITIVRRDAADNTYGNYQETKQGSSLQLTAPIDPGAHEVRYVSGRSRTILGRAAIEVMPAGATLDAAAEVIIGAPFSVTWTGPNNKDDYITVVPKDARDDEYGSYTNTDKGSPLTLTAPPAADDAELRYVTGQDKKVLARRPIRIMMPDVALSAPAEAIAGTTLAVTWTGPDNAGDYITVVASTTPDGQYGNYTNTSTGSPLNLLMPIMNGDAELRYMTGQGRQVLGRRAIKIVAAQVILAAAAECAPGSDISITWTGPNNSGDYITVVARSTPDGQYAAYTNTTKGSPLTVKAPGDVGDAEIRYMTGQGNKVLARIPIKVVR